MRLISGGSRSPVLNSPLHRWCPYSTLLLFDPPRLHFHILRTGNAEGAGLPAGRQVSPADKSQENTSPGDPESKKRLYALIVAISTQQYALGG